MTNLVVEVLIALAAAKKPVQVRSREVIFTCAMVNIFTYPIAALCTQYDLLPSVGIEFLVVFFQAAPYRPILSFSLRSAADLSLLSNSATCLLNFCP